jgi:hypothetical protein
MRTLAPSPSGTIFHAGRLYENSVARSRAGPDGRGPRIGATRSGRTQSGRDPIREVARWPRRARMRAAVNAHDRCHAQRAKRRSPRQPRTAIARVHAVRSALIGALEFDALHSRSPPPERTLASLTPGTFRHTGSALLSREGGPPADRRAHAKRSLIESDPLGQFPSLVVQRAPFASSDFQEHEIGVRKNRRRGFAGMSRQIRRNSRSSDIRRADAFMLLGNSSLAARRED